VLVSSDCSSEERVESVTFSLVFCSAFSDSASLAVLLSTFPVARPGFTFSTSSIFIAASFANLFQVLNTFRFFTADIAKTLTPSSRFLIRHDVRHHRPLH